MFGVVNLDKPEGPTSHDMVGLLRRLTGTRRIGHAGTLDPLASGVLPILVGPATRFSEELTASAKRYDAVVRLGMTSATDDGEGPLTPTGAQIPEPAEVFAALQGFVGPIDQRPPAFSARKRGGMTAHREARAGRPLELPSRRVSVERIAEIGIEPGDGWLDVRFDLRCGPGTYVRSIARDLGERLRCGGYLHRLRRLEAAGLRAADGMTPRRLEELAADGRLADALLPVGELLPLPRVSLGADDATRFRNGSVVRIDTGLTGGRYAAFAGAELLGVGRMAAGLLQPVKVIAVEHESSASTSS